MNTNLDLGERKQNQYPEIQYTHDKLSFGAKKQKSSAIKLSKFLNHWQYIKFMTQTA